MTQGHQDSSDAQSPRATRMFAALRLSIDVQIVLNSPPSKPLCRRRIKARGPGRAAQNLERAAKFSPATRTKSALQPEIQRRGRICLAEAGCFLERKYVIDCHMDRKVGTGKCRT